MTDALYMGLLFLSVVALLETIRWIVGQVTWMMEAMEAGDYQ